MKTPPRIAKWILSITNRKENRETVLGDFEEIYDEIQANRGRCLANIWFYNQAIISIPKFLITTIYWESFMLKNYFKIALANLLKQRFYSFITVLGLAVGFGIFLYFFTLFKWGISPDTFHKDIDRIYNVVQVFNAGNEGDRRSEFMPYPLASAIKNEIPEIEDVSSIIQSNQVILKYKDKIFFEDGMIYADKNFFSFFTFEIIEGNPKTILSKPNSIVLTKSLAEKYFGNESPLGKIISLENKADLIVTGVIKNRESSSTLSSIYFNFLVSMESYQNIERVLLDWSQNINTGFIKLRKGPSVNQVDKKLDVVMKKYFPQIPEAPKQAYLFPMKDNLFKAHDIIKYCGRGTPTGYIIFLVLGIFFLFIVCINFVNLSTAKYMDRSKEVGIRKVIGANRSQLILQFLSESILLTLMAIPIAGFVYNFR